MVRPRVPESVRFWSYVDKTSSAAGCWLWVLPSVARYGQFSLARSHKDKRAQRIRAHRWAWENTNGPIPDGLWALHNCPGGDNAMCVNPAHLYLGTPTDNNRDTVRKGRAVFNHGAKAPNSKLTDERAHWIRQLSCYGWSRERIAQAFNVSPQTIGDICRRKTWKHVV